jgi:hypothetical protein
VSGLLRLGLGLLAAAVWLERRLVIVALLAYLTFSVPHLVFHVEHLHGLSGVEATVLVALLAGSVALPLALLAVAVRPRPRPGQAVSARSGTSRTAAGAGRPNSQP